MSIVNVLKKLNSRDTKILPNFSKLSKFVLILIIFVFSFFFIKQIFATSQLITDFQAKQNAIEKGNNQEAWINSALISNSLSLTQAIGGSLPQSLLEGNIPWIPGGILGVSNNAIASLYIPPASGVEYIAQTFNTFLGKPAYAQGVGFSGLNGILKIWQAFRNAAYVIFSLFFVIIGIMIMLRVKISPQAVITIQNSIPKIITTLVLVTFSYAIAGLLIDFSYLILGIVLNIINIDGSIKDVQREITNPNVLALLIELIPPKTITLLGGFPGMIVTLLGGGVFLAAALNIMAGGPLGLLGMALAALVLFIFTIIFTVKFLFGLAKCYINLILRIIFGPLEISLGVIPNMKMGFSSWILNVVANLAVFPITIIFLILLRIITSSIGNGLWIPPSLSVIENIVPVIIGMGGFMLVSKLPDLIPEFIFQIKPSPFGKAIGEGFKEIGSGGIAKFVKNSAAEEADYQVRTRITNPFFDKTAKDKENRALGRGHTFKGTKPSGENDK